MASEVDRRMASEVGSAVCAEAQIGRKALKAAKSNGKLLNELKSGRAIGKRVVAVWQELDKAQTDGLDHRFRGEWSDMLFMDLWETVNEPIVAVDDLSKLQVIPSVADKVAIAVVALAEHGEELERDRLARFVDQNSEKDEAGEDSVLAEALANRQDVDPATHEQVVDEVLGELIEAAQIELEAYV